MISKYLFVDKFFRLHYLKYILRRVEHRKCQTCIVMQQCAGFGRAFVANFKAKVKDLKRLLQCVKFSMIITSIDYQASLVQW